MDAAWRQGITRRRRPRKTIFSGAVNAQRISATFKDRLTRVESRVRGALRKEKGRSKRLSSVPFQAGVLPVANRKTELLFVTLDKSDGYHDSISYRDYAINAERFHWQTQNSAGPDTPAGKRYLESSTNGWQFQLFVRARKGDAYRACGRVALESAEGDRPMSIVWRLETPLSARLFREFSVLRGM